jgi:hypothetical protein
VAFSEGDYAYIKEMTIGVGKSKKFRTRWKGPYLITKRLSDLNYQIQLKPGKCVTVNVNRMKKCYTPPRGKRTMKKTVLIAETKQLDDDWSDSDNEPLSLLGRLKIIPTLQDNFQNLESTEADNVTVTDDAIRDDTDTSDTPNRGQDREGRSVDIADAPRYHLRSRGGSQSAAINADESREVTNQQNDAISNEENDNEQGRPCPYFLRPLPGRRT